MFELEIEPREVRLRLTTGQKIRIVDVREPFEYQIARLEGGELIPMRAVPQAFESLRATAEPIIVLCHHGVRSLQVVNWLRGQGIENCLSMAGGIDRWSVEIDPAVPRY